MPLYSLPSTAEQVFADYISGNYTGSYPVFKSFCVDSVVYPSIVVEAADFRQYEPDTHLYRANCTVGIATQIDDVADPVAQHDANTAEVYDLIADKTALASAANVSGNGFHLINSDIVSFSRRRAESPSRALVSIIELELFCQTLEP